jgi:hypothetical protein
MKMFWDNNKPTNLKLSHLFILILILIVFSVLLISNLWEQERGLYDLVILLFIFVYGVLYKLLYPKKLFYLNIIYEESDIRVDLNIGIMFEHIDKSLTLYNWRGRNKKIHIVPIDNFLRGIIYEKDFQLISYMLHEKNHITFDYNEKNKVKTY